MTRYTINSISSIFIIVLIVLLFNKYSNNENFSNLNKTNNLFNTIINNYNIKSIKNNKNNRQTLYLPSDPKNKKIFGIVGLNSLDTGLDKQNLWNMLELKYGENMASTVLSKKNSVPFLIDKNKLNLKTYILIVYRNNNIHFYLHKTIKCVYKKFNIPNNISLPFINSNTENIIVDNPLLPYRIEDLYHNLQYKYGIPSHKISKLKFDIKRNLKLVTFALNNKIINNINKNNKNNSKTKTKYSHFDLLEIDLLIDNGLYPYILEINKFNTQPENLTINDKINSIKEKVLLDALNKVELLNIYNNQFILL